MSKAAIVRALVQNHGILHVVALLVSVGVWMHGTVYEMTATMAFVPVGYVSMANVSYAFARTRGV